MYLQQVLNRFAVVVVSAKLLAWNPSVFTAWTAAWEMLQAAVCAMDESQVKGYHAGGMQSYNWYMASLISSYGRAEAHRPWALPRSHARR